MLKHIVWFFVMCRQNTGPYLEFGGGGLCMNVKETKKTKKWSENGQIQGLVYEMKSLKGL